MQEKHSEGPWQVIFDLHMTTGHCHTFEKARRLRSWVTHESLPVGLTPTSMAIHHSPPSVYQKRANPGVETGSIQLIKLYGPSSFWFPGPSDRDKQDEGTTCSASCRAKVSDNLPVIWPLSLTLQFILKASPLQLSIGSCRSSSNPLPWPEAVEDRSDTGRKYEAWERPYQPLPNSK